MATLIRPEDLVFGTPTSLKFGTDEIGATLDPPVWTCTPKLYKPEFENAVGPVMGTVIIIGADVEAAVTVNEFTAASLAMALPGAEEIAGEITWSPGRVAIASHKDLTMVGKNLAGNDLTVVVKNALPEGPVSIPFAKSEIASMKLKFVGYVDGDTPQELPFRVNLGSGS